MKNLIFHGGFYSPVKGLFYQKIYKSAGSDGHFFHYGNIDLGGFKMFLRLKNNIIPGLQLYRMNANELKMYQEFGVIIKNV